LSEVQKIMHQPNIKIMVLITAVLAAALISGCGRAASSAAGEDAVSGRITVSGAWALYPLMVRWGEEFQKVHPNVQFDVSAGGAGKGMADALSDAVDIGMVSREIYPAEIDQGAFAVPVAKDAVFPTVNQKNPVGDALRQKGVSQNTLVGIFITGQVTGWGQVVNLPKAGDPIHVYTRSDAAGAPATWANYLGGSQEDLLGVGVYGDPGLLEAVIKDPLGIGYNNLGYIFDAETGQLLPGVQILPIDVNHNGQVDPGELFATKAEAVLAVAENRYPSPPARDLYLVTKGRPTGLANTFITWILTDGQAFVEEAGYVVLPQAKLAESLNNLK
jgi:phosphate transport system substrate-binding protein